MACRCSEPPHRLYPFTRHCIQPTNGKLNGTFRLLYVTIIITQFTLFPPTSAEDCLEIWQVSDYKWNDGRCDGAVNKYVCETRLVFRIFFATWNHYHHHVSCNGLRRSSLPTYMTYLLKLRLSRSERKTRILCKIELIVLHFAMQKSQM